MRFSKAGDPPACHADPDVAASHLEVQFPEMTESLRNGGSPPLSLLAWLSIRQQIPI